MNFFCLIFVTRSIVLAAIKKLDRPVYKNMRPHIIMETSGKIRSTVPKVIDVMFAMMYRTEDLLVLFTIFWSGVMSFSFCCSRFSLILLSMSLNFSCCCFFFSSSALRWMRLLYFLEMAPVYFDNLSFRWRMFAILVTPSYMINRDNRSCM